MWIEMTKSDATIPWDKPFDPDGVDVGSAPATKVGLVALKFAQPEV